MDTWVSVCEGSVSKTNGWPVCSNKPRPPSEAAVRSVRRQPPVSSLHPVGNLNLCPLPLVRAEGGRRHGYMGHLTRIANCIVHSTDKGPNSALVQQLIKGRWRGEPRRRAVGLGNGVETLVALFLVTWGVALVISWRAACGP